MNVLTKTKTAASVCLTLVFNMQNFKVILILLAVLSVVVAGVTVALSQNSPTATTQTTKPNGDPTTAMPTTPNTPSNTTSASTTTGTMSPDVTTGGDNGGLGSGVELPDDPL